MYMLNMTVLSAIMNSLPTYVFFLLSAYNFCKQLGTRSGTTKQYWYSRQNFSKLILKNQQMTKKRAKLPRGLRERLIIGTSRVQPWLYLSGNRKIYLKSTDPQIREQNGKLFFFYLDKNICCGCSKEPSEWDGAFEHPKHMLKLMDKKSNHNFMLKIFVNWGYVSRYGLTFCLLVISADNFCKQFGPRSGQTKCWAWSGSELLDTLMVFLEVFF